MDATKTAKPLPKLPGAVCAQWRIYKGKWLGPYYFRCWREGGKLRKQYVKRADLDATVAACAAYREERRASRIQRSVAWHLLREYTRLLREVKHGR